MYNPNANMNIGTIFTKEFLENECKYKTNKQIAVENKCSASTVKKYLHKYGLRCFNPTNKGRIAWNRKNETENSRYCSNRDNKNNILKRRYHNVMENYIGRSIDCSHEVVHHLNRDSKDDRLENLVLMEKKDHDRLHLILRNKHMYNCSLLEALNYLFKDDLTDEMKRYAELTRIIPATKKCKK